MKILRRGRSRFASARKFSSRAELHPLFGWPLEASYPTLLARQAHRSDEASPEIHNPSGSQEGVAYSCGLAGEGQAG